MPTEEDREPIELWFWTITSERTGKRVKTSWRMTDETARERYGEDAVKVEGTREVRTYLGHTGDLKIPPRRS